MIKLPDAITADHAPEVDEIYMAVDGMGLKGSYAAYAAGFNAAIEKVQHLNATAQPKCQKCGDTGMADSGGIQPWGEQILIECDCATAQPVSDNPSLKAMMRALDTFYAHDDVPETAILKAFRILLADVMPAAPGGQ